MKTHVLIAIRTGLEFFLAITFAILVIATFLMFGKFEKTIVIATILLECFLPFMFFSLVFGMVYINERVWVESDSDIVSNIIRHVLSIVICICILAGYFIFILYKAG